MFFSWVNFEDAFLREEEGPQYSGTSVAKYGICYISLCPIRIVIIELRYQSSVHSLDTTKYITEHRRTNFVSHTDVFDHTNLCRSNTMRK
jgi:hypothetical protein